LPGLGGPFSSGGPRAAAYRASEGENTLYVLGNQGSSGSRVLRVTGLLARCFAHSIVKERRA